MKLLMAVDTAVIVPVTIAPLIDDADFKSIESPAYNAAGLALYWNFVTPAGVQTQTAVTPTTGGDYDWTATNGIVKIEIPASGGASINNDTEGYGWFSGVATGVLPWCGPIITFAPAHVVNGLVTGTDKLQTDVAEWLGTAAATPTIPGVPEVDPTHWKGVALPIVDTAGYPVVTVKDGTGAGEIALTAGKVDGVATVDAVTVVNGLAPNTITAASTAADVVTEIQDGLATASALSTAQSDLTAILTDSNELQTDLTNGGRLDLIFDAILADTDSLDTTKLTTARAAVLSDWIDGGRLDLILDSRASQASLDLLDTDVAAILAAVDTEVAAILTDTGTDLPAQIAALLTTAGTESYRADGATGSVFQLLYETIAHLGESSIVDTTKTTKRIDGSTTAASYTLNSSSAPTSITRAS